jgi:predicted aspartyl protease
MRTDTPFTSDHRGARLIACLMGVVSSFCSGVTPSKVSEQAAGPVASADAALFASPTTRDHIGRVVVPVTINGRGPFRFIVDTGANHSTISSRLVQTLGLHTAETTPVVLDGITGSAQVTYVTVDRLQAGDLTLEQEYLPVVSALVMAGADGILGAAGLTNRSLMVDFQHNRVAIASSVGTAVRSGSTRIRAIRLTHGLITLETRVGGVRVQAVIDTGSERTLGNLALRNALHSPNLPGAIVQMTSVLGATPEIESGEIRRAPPITVDSLRITDVSIVYGDFHIFKVWDMADRPAMIIGMDVLGTIPTLGIDFEKLDVYVAGVRGSSSSLEVMNK